MPKPHPLPGQNPGPGLRLWGRLGALPLAFCGGLGIAADAPPGGQDIPCPPGWRVEANASVENSLSYAHATQQLAVSVSYIAAHAGSNVSAESYARVAAQKMVCTMPVMSNMIAGGWSFYCDDLDIEAVVYGPDGNLVLLAISGRNAQTEGELENFIRFLAWQARH